MSLFCPKCWAKAKCLDSRTDALTNTVRRRFECLDSLCKNRFTSVELILGEVDLRKPGGSSLIKLVWEIFDKLGGSQAESNFVESWLESRRKSLEKRSAERGSSKRKAVRPSTSHPWRASAAAMKDVASQVAGKC